MSPATNVCSAPENGMCSTTAIGGPLAVSSITSPLRTRYGELCPALQ
jgi:hypothetical protein